MKHVVCFALLAMFGVLPGLAQSEDTETLRDILSEIRALHNDVRLSQTTQILLTELEVQRGVVDKATEKRDSARSRVSNLQMNEKNFAAQITQLEDNAKSMTLDPARQKQLADQAQMLKGNIASFKSQEDDAQSALMDAENALRKEQGALQSIQDRLDEVVKKLQPANN
jgi:truncated hemoglobin YjbI